MAENIKNQPNITSVTVDKRIIDKIIQDTDIETVPLLIDCFINEMNSRVINIELAQKEQDLQSLEFEAHTLGSAALALGCVELGDYAREIEMHCLHEKSSNAWQLALGMKQLSHQTKVALIQCKEQIII